MWRKDAPHKAIDELRKAINLNESPGTSDRLSWKILFAKISRGREVSCLRKFLVFFKCNRLNCRTNRPPIKRKKNKISNSVSGVEQNTFSHRVDSAKVKKFSS